ncbi:MAG: protein translocase subunit SecF [Caldisericia bacterium]|nr:protein translocase subunit SecF [Caldisericia bacterium]
MIIWNPRKWDIIGKLRWLVLAFVAIIVLSTLIVGIRWIASGSSASELKIIFKEPAKEEASKIISEASQIALANKLDNINVNVLDATGDFKANQRVNIQANEISSDAAAKITASLQEKFGPVDNSSNSTIKIPGQPFNWGLDFTGGTIMNIAFKDNFKDNGEPMSDEKVLEKVRIIFAQNGVPINTLQVQRNVAEAESGKTWANAILVRTQEASEAKRQAVLADLSKKENFGEIDKNKFSVDTIGPVVGQELKNKMVLALLVALGIIFIYISFRFQPRAAVSAIVCLIHDALLVFGVLAITNVEINSPAVAALLAIISYDVQDTVVIMDRVRENSRYYVGKMTYAAMINESITETYIRSINTGTTTLIGIIILLIFGGSSILDFTLIFFVGLLAGTWSSIYIAAPLLVIWKNAELKSGKKTEAPILVATATSTASISTTIQPNQNASASDIQSYRKGPPPSKRKGSSKRRR